VFNQIVLNRSNPNQPTNLPTNLLIVPAEQNRPTRASLATAPNHNYYHRLHMPDSAPTHAHPQSQAIPASLLTPIWAALTLTFLCSASGVITSGIYYITKQTYGFTSTANYALALLQGVTYIVGALAAGPILRYVLRRWNVSPRSILFALMLIMAGLAAIPWLAIHMLATAPSAISGTPSGTPLDIIASSPPAWPIWLLITLYSPLTGALWPMVEAYVSGGKSGRRLRSTIGWWNVTWSSALVGMSLSIAPLIEAHGSLAILLAGGLHLISIFVLFAFARQPAPHVTHAIHATHFAVNSHKSHEQSAHERTIAADLALALRTRAQSLLVTFRLLLPTSYVVSTALVPFLPSQMARIGIEPAHFTIVGSVWLFGRVIGFLTLQQWQGWHNRWWPTILSPILLLVGLALSVFAHVPLIGQDITDSASAHVQTAAGSLLVAGLFCHGLAMSTIYTGAIYYAMDTSEAQVDSGGTHEALIGVGYTIGPLCGLLAASIAHLTTRDSLFEPTLMSLVGAIALIMAGITARRVARIAHSTPT